MYESLQVLPGTVRDRHGNLGLVGAGDEGPRKRLEYLLALDESQLAGVILSELLDWFRWGSHTSVMWECTLPELIKVIEKWLVDNPTAPRELFSPHFTVEWSWDELWSELGMKGEMRERRKCCVVIYSEFHDCCVCGKRWFEMERVFIGPRGEGTYNLVLDWAAGKNVAVAVWAQRGQPLTLPRGFE